MSKRMLVVAAVVIALCVIPGMALADESFDPSTVQVDATTSNAVLEALANTAATVSPFGIGTGTTARVAVEPVLKGNSCSWQVWGDAGYRTQGTFVYEYWDLGSEYGCDRGSMTLSLNASIADKGIPLVSDVHQTSGSVSESDGGTNLFVDQTVGLYTFPTDYHAWGSLITYKARVRADYPWGGSETVCLGGTAVYGLPTFVISEEPCVST